MDWTGNNNAVRASLGLQNNPEYERESNDFYATEPAAVEWLVKLENLNENIWECACGQGHISKVLEDKGYNVKSSDLIPRGYGVAGVNFLEQKEVFDGDIITNPPYKYAQEFVEKGLELVPDGKKVIMFLKLQFMESKQRKKLFAENPPKTIWVSSSRLHCAKNGDFDNQKSNMMAFAWFVWEKGFKGNTNLKWFN